MKLVHYSEQCLPALSRTPLRGDTCHKPGGLWLSDDDAGFGWLDHVAEALKSDQRKCWINDAQKIQYKTEFAIKGGEIDNLLVINCAVELEKFSLRYKENQPRDCCDGSGNGFHIQWNLVKAKYKGILITPYIPELAWHKGDPLFHWYRFDCASGCFWDITCLRKISGSEIMNPLPFPNSN